MAELGAIAASELGVPVGIMAVPLSQLSGGRDLLAPVVEARPLLAEPSWPEPVDEHRSPSSGSGGSYTRRTCTCAAFAIRLSCVAVSRLARSWLSVRSLIGGFLDGELGRRVCLKAFVRDGRTAADGPTVAAVLDPAESPI